MLDASFCNGHLLVKNDGKMSKRTLFPPFPVLFVKEEYTLRGIWTPLQDSARFRSSLRSTFRMRYALRSRSGNIFDRTFRMDVESAKRSHLEQSCYRATSAEKNGCGEWKFYIHPFILSALWFGPQCLHHPLKRNAYKAEYPQSGRFEQATVKGPSPQK